jgi:hypothetical protein
MADRTAPDVRLRDLGDGERRLDPGVGACALECVLQREGVQQRREHSRVVGRRTLHPLRRCCEAAVEVPGADDDRDVDARRADDRDLVRERLDHVRVDAVVAPTHERLARELEEDSPEAGRSGLRRLDRLLGPHAHRRQPASEKR